jgi:hypothetical protein
MLDLPIKPTLREFRRWVFPDFLWLLTMLLDRPLRDGPGITARAIRIGQEAFDRGHVDQVFHGCLTDWEAVPQAQRRWVLLKLQELCIYEAVVPEAFAHALGVYKLAPGRWLIRPRIKAGLEPSVEEAEKHLGTLAINAIDSHQALATHAIFLWIRSLVLARRIRHDGGPVFTDILPRYPHAVNDAERRIAETTLRAMFVADFHHRSQSPLTEDWCQRFWRANKGLFDCLFERPDPDDPPDLEKAELATANFRKLQYEFLVASDATNTDLWDFDRHDVLTGMTWRALRIAEHLISHTSMWSEENGYSSVRALFEAYVQMTWMLKMEASRPTVWFEFKDYGRGRIKAMKLHTEKAAATATGLPKELLDGLKIKLERDLNRDQNEDFQAISTAPTFIEGKSLQAMAREVGMEELYESAMVPASSAVHGDWSALDDMFLDRCVHPLHGPHALPRKKPASESNEKIPFVVESYSRWILRTYYAAFGYRVPRPTPGQAPMEKAAGAKPTRLKKEASD